mgnify:CR=1 FL=1
MDKMTTGFVTIPKGMEASVRDDIKSKYEAICFNEYGVKAKVKVVLIPISTITDEPMMFTHGYKIRCRG